MANKHSEEVSQMRSEVMDVERKLHQAEAAVNDVVHYAERELVAKTDAICSKLACRMCTVCKPSSMSALRLTFPSQMGLSNCSPWHKRCGQAFKGKCLPFGCRVDYWVRPKAQRKNLPGWGDHGANMRNVP